MSRVYLANSEVQRLDEKHLKEWLDSGVSHEVIALNVETLTDAQAVARLLNLPLNGLHGWGAKDL